LEFVIGSNARKRIVKVVMTSLIKQTRNNKRLSRIRYYRKYFHQGTTHCLLLSSLQIEDSFWLNHTRTVDFCLHRQEVFVY